MKFGVFKSRKFMEQDIRTIRNFLGFAFAGLLIYCISILSSLLIPLTLALFFAILLQPIMAWFERKNFPFIVSLTLIAAGAISILALIGILIYETAVQIAGQQDKLAEQIEFKVTGILANLSLLTGETIDFNYILEMSTQVISWQKVGQYLGTLAGGLGGFSGSFFMTSLYLVAFLSGILQYEKYIHYLEGAPAKKEQETDSNLLKAFEQIKSSLVTYVKIKFLVSLGTGIFYWLICLGFGIDFAIFWGFLAFILNFIPTVGSIIATIPPLLLGLVQLDSMSMAFLMSLLLLTAQLIFGNVVEPKLTGASLSLNTVVVILGLVFWGYLWGITGMILSVPLLVLIKVILEQIPDAKILVKLMGDPNLK